MITTLSVMNAVKTPLMTVRKLDMTDLYRLGFSSWGRLTARSVVMQAVYAALKEQVLIFHVILVAAPILSCLGTLGTSQMGVYLSIL